MKLLHYILTIIIMLLALLTYYYIVKGATLVLDKPVSLIKVLIVGVFVVAIAYDLGIAKGRQKEREM